MMMNEGEVASESFDSGHASESFDNRNGGPILVRMVAAIQTNKAYLSEIDGLIGDGDHGMNMNKGFSLFAARFLAGDRLEAGVSFTDGLDKLGQVLLGEIGGSMGPIYGTLFMAMAEAANAGADLNGDSTVAAAACGNANRISLECFHKMISAGLTELLDVVEARVGDKTLIDALMPAVAAVAQAIRDGRPFVAALSDMKTAAEEGKESTRELIARYGRSSRLGERSRGVLDAGAVSCCLILQAMADAIIELLDAKA